MQAPSQQQLHHVLSSRFGFADFRPGQLEAITTLLREKRLLCILPTGHGKSLLYQLPATMIDGLTLVISPLLALMRDQISQLTSRFGLAAASLNSDQSLEENEQAARRAASGQVQILFVAPERLDKLETFQFLLSLPIGLLVVAYPRNFCRRPN